MKRWLYGFLAFALVFGLVAVLPFSAEAKNYNLKISHIRPTDTAIDKDVKWLDAELQKASGGRIKLSIFPAGQLGDYTVVQERVGVGAVDMAVQPMGAAADKRMLVSSFPYLADSWASARKIYVSGSPLMNEVGNLLEKQNIKLLAVWPVYFGGVALKKMPANPMDPNVAQNIKVRVPPIKSYQVMAEAFGYQATPLPFSETFTAVQTGIVDGIIGAGAEGYYSNFRDVIKYYLPINTHFEQWYLVMNLDLWKSMSKEDKDILMKVTQEFEKRRWAAAEKDQAYNEKRLEEYGIKVLRPTIHQISAFTKKARSTVWPQIKGDVGAEYFDNLLKAMNIKP